MGRDWLQIMSDLYVTKASEDDFYNKLSDEIMDDILKQGNFVGIDEYMSNTNTGEILFIDNDLATDLNSGFMLTPSQAKHFKEVVETINTTHPTSISLDITNLQQPDIDFIINQINNELSRQ